MSTKDNTKKGTKKIDNEELYKFSWNIVNCETGSII